MQVATTLRQSIEYSWYPVSENMTVTNRIHYMRSLSLLLHLQVTPVSQLLKQSWSAGFLAAAFACDALKTAADRNHLAMPENRCARPRVQVPSFGVEGLGAGQEVRRHARAPYAHAADCVHM